MLILLSVTSGIAVGNVYFPQAIIPSIATGLDIGPEAAASIVTAVQVGYSVGLFLLVPLGDRIPYRRLILTLLGLTAAGLLAAGVAPGPDFLLLVGVQIGATTVVAPIIGSMAAGLVPSDRRGAVGGVLLSGATGGMLLSRLEGGALAEVWGWRAPYLVAGIATLVVAFAVGRALPKAPAPTTERFLAVLAAPVRLLWSESDLRRSCLYQATVFAGFSAVWATVGLLLAGPAYRLDERAVGVLALVNIATMFVTPVAGRLADRHGPDRVNLVCLLGVVLAAGVLYPAAAGLETAGGPATLIAGTLLLDVSMQSGMVANQVRIYALRPDARARLNTAYMTCAYLGGAGGSALGLRAYGQFGWHGVCGLVALLAGIALTRLRIGSTGTGLSGPSPVRAPKTHPA
ncbi:MFS transporter [Cryptosporangium sp. NPDC048952]|uniref:MFS transporter n=1 Tax=Cryptosporangium sp. NPDC048952 TaxID=3363961 RepID=UPI00371192CD